MSRKRFLAIVDPWAEPLEHDVEEYPFLQSDISAQCRIIDNQLPRLKSLFDDIIVIKTHKKTNPIFDELPSVDGVLGEYLSDKQDWDMWLCGFHYGRCIHLKIDEVIEQYGWNYNRFHIIQNLSFLFPGEEKRSRYQQDWIIDIAKNVKVYNWDYISNFYIGSSAIYTDGI